MAQGHNVEQEPRDAQGRWTKAGVVSVNLSPEIRAVLDSLRAAGGHPFIVGGSVRDAALGHVVKDTDIEVGGLTHEQVVRALSKHGVVDQVGKSFGVYKVRLSNGEDLDISLPRRERKTAEGHKGFAVEPDPFMSPQEAAARRDFTINSLMYDPHTGTVHDYHGGLADLKNKRLRHVGPAFGEDPLRVLRAMQFAARFGFDLDPHTAQVAQGLKKEYTTIAKERIWTEWEKVAQKAKQPSKAIDVLRATGWIDFYPELKALDGVPQEPDWHPEGGVLTHTKHVMDEAARIADRDHLKGDQRTILILAALCHDFGKAIPGITQVTEKNGVQRITSYGHDDAGVDPSRSFLERIGCPLSLRQSILTLVKEHMAHTGVQANHRTVTRLAHRLDPVTVRDWERIVEADHSGRPPLPKSRPAKGWLDIAETLGASKGKVKPLIGGDMLIARGLKPGPQFKGILNAAYDAQMDKEVTAENAAGWLDRYLAEHGFVSSMKNKSQQPLLFLAKAEHDVSDEPRDKDGKWTKEPGSGIPTAAERAAYAKRVAENPQPGDTVFVGDKTMADYGDIYEVTKGAHENGLQNNLIKIRKSYWAEGKEASASLGVWQKYIKDGNLIPRMPGDVAPDPSPEMLKEIRKDCATKEVQQIKDWAYSGYMPSQVLEKTLNVLCLKPPKDFSFTLKAAVPGVSQLSTGKEWTVTEGPKTTSLKSKVTLTAKDGEKVTLSVKDWVKTARSGEVPFTVKQVTDLLPTKCQECGKEIQGKDIHTCPFCSNEYCAADIAKHEETCSEKAVCAKCGKVMKKTDAVKCPYCGKTFCVEHASADDHDCPSTVACSVCGHKTYYKYMTKDPTTGKVYCQHDAEQVLGAADFDGDGVLGVSDIVSNNELARKTKDRLVRTILARLKDNPDFDDFLKDRKRLRYVLPGTAMATGQSEAYEAVNSLIKSWAVTSCDNNRLAIALQKAAIKEFNLSDNVVERPWESRTLYDASSSVPVEVRQKAIDDSEPAMRAFLRAMYDNTQEYFARKGVKNVTLYRGFSYDTKGLEELRGTLTGGMSKPIAAEAKLQPMSSFSTDVQTADTFSGDRGLAVVMETKDVPVEDVLSTAMTGFGCLNEQEMVVLGNSLKPCLVGPISAWRNKQTEQSNGKKFWYDVLPKNEDVLVAKSERRRPLQISVDRDIQNADWTKQSWDLPTYKSKGFWRSLKTSGMDLAHFRTLPVFKHLFRRHGVTKSQQPLLLLTKAHDVSKEPRDKQGKWTRQEISEITPAKLADMDLFVRWGKPPKSGLSLNHDTGQREKGVSCYRALYDPEEGRVFFDVNNVSGTYLRYSLVGMKPYLLTGKEVGIGTGEGEPVIGEARVLAQLRMAPDHDGFLLPVNFFAKRVAKSHDVSKEPRDKQGKWAKVNGLPDDVQIDPGDMALHELLHGEHFDLAATSRKNDLYGDNDFVLSVKPRLDKRYHREIPGSFEGDPPKGWYDTRLAHIEDGKGDDLYQPHYVRLNANLPAEYSQDLPAKPEKGHVWRGLSWEEMQAIKKSGAICSHGQYNIGDAQKGLTYFADDPGMAESYAGNFAPPASIPTFDRPSYLIKVPDPGETGAVRLPHIPGEVGLKGLVPASKIEEIYEMQPFSVDAGEYELRTDHGLPKPTFSSGSSTKPGADYVFRKVTDVPGFLQGKEGKMMKSFDPNQPRDEKGRWTKLAQGELAGMAADAKKYKDFQDYSRDWSVMGMRGQYWHLTNRQNFKIDPDYRPNDYASNGDLGGDGTAGLQVSSDPEWWHRQLPKGRRWAAEIDLSRAKRNQDYHVINRGFGSEVFINNAAAVSVKRVVPYKQAVQEAQRYTEIGPQSEEELRDFWTTVNKTTVPAAKSHQSLMLLSKSSSLPEVGDEVRIRNFRHPLSPYPLIVHGVGNDGNVQVRRLDTPKGALVSVPLKHLLLTRRAVHRKNDKPQPSSGFPNPYAAMAGYLDTTKSHDVSQEPRDEKGRWTAVGRLVYHLQQNKSPELHELVDNVHWGLGPSGVMPAKARRTYIDYTQDGLLAARETGYSRNQDAYYKTKDVIQKLDEQDQDTLERLIRGDIPAEWGHDPAYIDHLKKWGNGSKLLDDEGVPYRLYHGTPSVFRAFDPTRRGSSTHMSDAKKAFFFTGSPEDAGFFSFFPVMQKYDDFQSVREGKNPAESGTPNVMPVHVRLRKPLVLVDESGAMDMELLNGALDLAHRKGYDGIVMYAGVSPIEDHLHYDGHQVLPFKKVGTVEATGMSTPIYDPGSAVLPRQSNMVVCAFNPVDVKSALGDNGNFDESSDLGKSHGLFLLNKSGHDVSGEPRDKKGEWAKEEGFDLFKRQNQQEIPVLDKAFQEWAASLTPGQRAAIKLYTQPKVYKKLNTALRSPKNQGKPLKEYLNENDFRIAALFSKAIQQGHLPKDMTLFRGLDGDFAQTLASAKPGDVVSDSAFLSTSINPLWAQSFAEGPQGVIVQIHAPQGTPAAYINAVDLSSQEHELTLPRKTKLQVIAKKVWEYSPYAWSADKPRKYTIVEAKVLPQEVVKSHDVSAEPRDKRGRWAAVARLDSNLKRKKLGSLDTLVRTLIDDTNSNRLGPQGYFYNIAGVSESDYDPEVPYTSSPNTIATVRQLDSQDRDTLRRLVYGDIPVSRGHDAVYLDHLRHWAEGSKLVDREGLPYRVFHGSDARFRAFSLKKRGNATHYQDAKKAFFFAASPTDASRFATLAYHGRKNPDKSRAPQIYATYVRLKKPLVVIDSGGAMSAMVMRQALDYAADHGHDGVVMYEQDRPAELFSAVLDKVGTAYDSRGRASSMYSTDGILPRGGDMVVAVTDATDIKSATGNKGTFDDSSDLGKSHDVSGEPRNKQGEWTTVAHDNHHGSMAGKRGIDPTAPYWIYLNLHLGTKKPLLSKETGQPVKNPKTGKVMMVPDQKVWSMKNWKTGLVDQHTGTVYLKDVRMHIGQAGRRKVIQTGTKNVHAGVVGMVVKPEEAPVEGWQELHYNPKDHPELAHGFFMLADPQHPDQRISHAKYVRFTPQGTQVWGPIYKKGPHDDDLYLGSEANGPRAQKGVSHILAQVEPVATTKSLFLLEKSSAHRRTVQHPGSRGGVGFRDVHGNWRYGHQKPGHPGPSFTPSTLVNLFRHMPQDQNAKQPWDNERDLYGHAKEAEHELEQLLDKSVTKLQLDVYPVGHKPPARAYTVGQGFIRFAPIKGAKRASEKMEEYGGHWNRVLDIVRASVAVNDVPHLWAIVEGLKRAGATVARQPKNRFLHPTPAGYRDALLNVRLPDGMVAEVQLHLKPILQAKAAGHKQYEAMREIEHSLPQDGRMTSEQAKQYSQALRESKQIYDAAWQKAVGAVVTKSEGEPEGYRYYQMNSGALIRHRDNEQPEMFHPVHRTWVPYQHLVDFAYKATPVSAAHANKHLKPTTK